MFENESWKKIRASLAKQAEMPDIPQYPLSEMLKKEFAPKIAPIVDAVIETYMDALDVQNFSKEDTRQVCLDIRNDLKENPEFTNLIEQAMHAAEKSYRVGGGDTPTVAIELFLERVIDDKVADAVNKFQNSFQNKEYGEGLPKMQDRKQKIIDEVTQNMEVPLAPVAYTPEDIQAMNEEDKRDYISTLTRREKMIKTMLEKNKSDSLQKYYNRIVENLEMLLKSSKNSGLTKVAENEKPGHRDIPEENEVPENVEPQEDDLRYTELMEELESGKVLDKADKKFLNTYREQRHDNAEIDESDTDKHKHKHKQDEEFIDISMVPMGHKYDSIRSLLSFNADEYAKELKESNEQDVPLAISSHILKLIRDSESAGDLPPEVQGLVNEKLDTLIGRIEAETPEVETEVEPEPELGPQHNEPEIPRMEIDANDFMKLTELYQKLSSEFDEAKKQPIQHEIKELEERLERGAKLDSMERIAMESLPAMVNEMLKPFIQDISIDIIEALNAVTNNLTLFLRDNANPEEIKKGMEEKKNECVTKTFNAMVEANATQIGYFFEDVAPEDQPMEYAKLTEEIKKAIGNKWDEITDHNIAVEMGTDVDRSKVRKQQNISMREAQRFIKEFYSRWTNSNDGGVKAMRKVKAMAAKHAAMAVAAIHVGERGIERVKQFSNPVEKQEALKFIKEISEDTAKEFVTDYGADLEAVAGLDEEEIFNASQDLAHDINTALTAEYTTTFDALVEQGVDAKIKNEPKEKAAPQYKKENEVLPLAISAICRKLDVTKLNHRTIVEKIRNNIINFLNENKKNIEQGKVKASDAESYALNNTPEFNDIYTLIGQIRANATPGNPNNYLKYWGTISAYIKQAINFFNAIRSEVKSGLPKEVVDKLGVKYNRDWGYGYEKENEEGGTPAAKLTDEDLAPKNSRVWDKENKKWVDNE